MNRRFEKRIAVRFGLASGLVLAVIAVAVISLTTADSTANPVDETRSVLRSMGNVLSLLRDPEHTADDSTQTTGPRWTEPLRVALGHGNG